MHSQHSLAIVNLALEVGFHFIEQPHQVVKIGLDLIFEDFLHINFLVAPIIDASVLLVLGFGQLLVALVQTVDVLEGLTQRSWHLLVKILMMPFAFVHPVLYKLLCARLLDVVIEPGQVKLVHAEAHEVEEGLDVVDWRRVRVHPVFAQ